MVTQHLGTITYQEAPRTWTINVPEGSDKVEVAIYDYGKDSYYDVTSMVTTGENTITYYHFTDGPGIGVKVRIHRKV